MTNFFSDETLKRIIEHSMREATFEDRRRDRLIRSLSSPWADGMYKYRTRRKIANLYGDDYDNHDDVHCGEPQRSNE